MSLQEFPKFQYFDTKFSIVVFITSNYIGNTEIMQGCKENNIPCFGTLWDFVRRLLLHFLNYSNGCCSEKDIAFRKFTTTYTYTYLWSGVPERRLTLAIDFFTLHYAWAWMPHCINSHGQCQIYFRTYSWSRLYACAMIGYSVLDHSLAACRCFGHLYYDTTL